MTDDPTPWWANDPVLEEIRRRSPRARPVRRLGLKARRAGFSWSELGVSKQQLHRRFSTRQQG